LIVFILTVLNCFLSDGSFSKSLYGLRRRPVKVSVKRKSPDTESNEKEPQYRILGLIYSLNAKG